MFKKLIIIEPINILPYAVEELHKYAKEVVIYDDIPKSDSEISKRIADADAVLMSYTTQLNEEVLLGASKLKYIGLCCSLYSEQSSNVDIATAHSQGIVVKGVREYGDQGVAEFVVSELIQLTQGFGGKAWNSEPRELAGLKVGIIGLGATGTVVASALKYFGVDLSYYSRTPKESAEQNGIKYKELNTLLSESEVVCCCLTKNIVLLEEEQFEALGNHKVLINTGGGVPYDMKCLENFLNADNYFICDMPSALPYGRLHIHRNVRSIGRASGMTQQARVRLSQKVLANIETTLAKRRK